MKTNAVRVIERAGIPFELRYYELDEEAFTAEAAAAALAMPPETVFKTLIVHGDRTGYVFALIPAGTELDLRALAEASGNKRVELVPLRQVQEVTGYVRGAVTALAAKHSYPVIVDETVELWPAVGISGGAQGLEIVLAPADLMRATSAQLADIARQPIPPQRVSAARQCPEQRELATRTILSSGRSAHSAALRGATQDRPRAKSQEIYPCKPSPPGFPVCLATFAASIRLCR